MSYFRRFVSVVLVCLAGSVSAFADSLPLIDDTLVTDGWKFDNGREFPGATGELSNDPGAGFRGGDCLKLIGDFTGGGGYVQAMRRFEPVEVEALSFQVKAEGAGQFTMRIGDGSGQTHQIVIGVEPGSEWQLVNFPLQDFFESRGTSSAVTNVVRYQSWGGAGDGKWHGPATYVCFLLSNHGSNTVRTMWLEDLELDLAPQAVEGEAVVKEVSLSDVYDGFHEWRFSNGPEYKGAIGELAVESPEGEQPVFRLQGDFTNGGAYCAAIRDLEEYQVADLEATRMEVRSAHAKSVTIQLKDSTGQTHQRRNFPIQNDDAWNELVIDPEKVAGGEHWGGANDGTWHGPAKGILISVTRGSDTDLKPVLRFRNVVGEMVLPVFKAEPVFLESFEGEGIPENWKHEGSFELADTALLKLSRSLDGIESPVSVETPAFPVSTGRWLVRLKARPDLHSPDNSYRAAVTLVGFDAAGAVAERVGVLDLSGKGDGKAYEESVEVPAGVRSAALHVHFEKTYGAVYLDEISVSPLSPAPMTKGKVDRMLFSTVQLGNLLFPDDPRTVTVEVHCRKPLSEAERRLRWKVTDYWGAEQGEVSEIGIGSPLKSDMGIVYEVEVDLSHLPLEVGRYYEFHGELTSASGESFSNQAGLAILPEAVTHQYDPTEVPFTARNWDNRVEAYIRLTHRVGVRICGLWGGWSSKPPYEAKVPGLDLVKELGMGWLTNTPAARVERGSTDYTEEALREGVTNLLKEFADYRPLFVNLGNEPHGTGDKVIRNVAAYRTIYEAVKSFDPDLPVVATSVEPNEEYFQAGYGQYCDAFDFHIYESSERVRKTMREYRELQEKYDAVKPLWSTELGLNSQGMTRLRVAAEVHRKFASFFAEGGENVSWFGFLYPDPEGKALGTFGDSHNVFDSRYNRYNPRLDAVALYHAINSIAVKEFVEEKVYADGMKMFRFRDSDGKNLLIAWKEEGTKNVGLHLEGVKQLDGIEIDGRPFRMKSDTGAYHLAIGEPVLLQFAGESHLPETLEKSAIGYDGNPESIAPGESVVVSFSVSGETGSDLELSAPPLWKVKRQSDGHSFVLTAPADTSAREVSLVLKSKGEGNVYLPLRISIRE